MGLSLVQFSHSVVSDSCDPMVCSPPGFSVHGISQARTLEWVAIIVSRGSSQPRDRTQGLPHCRQALLPSEPPEKSLLDIFIKKKVL